jgi:hypothetical protein
MVSLPRARVSFVVAAPFTPGNPIVAPRQIGAISFTIIYWDTAERRATVAAPMTDHAIPIFSNHCIKITATSNANGAFFVAIPQAPPAPGRAFDDHTTSSSTTVAH